MEHLNRYHTHVNDGSIQQRLDEIKHQMARDWQDYERYQAIMHGEQTENNKLDMLLVFLIRRGFFDE